MIIWIYIYILIDISKSNLIIVELEKILQYVYFGSGKSLLTAFISLGHVDKFYFGSPPKWGLFFGGGPIKEVYHQKKKMSWPLSPN
jgi:hypothetical protein